MSFTSPSTDESCERRWLSGQVGWSVVDGRFRIYLRWVVLVVPARDFVYFSPPQPLGLVCCLYFAIEIIYWSKSTRYPAQLDRFVAVVVKILIPGCSRHHLRWRQGIPQRKYWAFAHPKYRPALQAKIVELFSKFSVVLAREPRCSKLNILSKRGRRLWEGWGSQTDHT